ncbi:hypothetical protein Xekj_04040 [Xenorhabdus sp. KJ12.1]|nr:hypothetical protein Xekj_04040 [Xenorhabdus sp. KJ12.1]
MLNITVSLIIIAIKGSYCTGAYVAYETLPEEKYLLKMSLKLLTI